MNLLNESNTTSDATECPMKVAAKQRRGEIPHNSAVIVAQITPLPVIDRQLIRIYECVPKPATNNEIIRTR